MLGASTRASFSNPSSTVSPGAYFRNHQHQPPLTSSLIQVHAVGNPQTNTWQTGVNLVKFAFFFKAFLPGFEKEVRGFFW
jgi:hypothetical protein